ncbi:MAG: hypothetical protein JWP31_1830 [Aeromicrobium sp.]|nr:hypothetical protein [Aeromicrobium sp.]
MRGPGERLVSWESRTRCSGPQRVAWGPSSVPRGDSTGLQLLSINPPDLAFSGPPQAMSTDQSRTTPVSQCRRHHSNTVHHRRPAAGTEPERDPLRQRRALPGAGHLRQGVRQRHHPHPVLPFAENGMAQPSSGTSSWVGSLATTLTTKPRAGAGHWRRSVPPRGGAPRAGTLPRARPCGR